jgi:deoxycytidylate deaminase
MNNRDYKFFELARQEALKSKFDRFHLGCVIVYKGHIIGRGANSDKTHPLQKKYNKNRNFNQTGGKPVKHSVHAEIAALSSIPYPIQESIDWSKVKIYTFRIAPGKKLHQGLSRPCDACIAAIRDRGIRHVFYTTSDGFAREEIF